MEIKTDGHTFVDNNFVYISGIADEGPTDLNDKVFQIFDVQSFAFKLNISNVLVTGKFSGQVTLYGGIRTNVSMSISWKPSTILCDVSNPNSAFSQFHVRYKKSYTELLVASIHVEPNAPVSITTTTPLKASKFEAGDIIILKNIPIDGPGYLSNMQLIVNWTESYTIYLYNLHHLNGSTTASYTLDQLVGTTLHHGAQNATDGTCHKWYASNFRSDTTCNVDSLQPNRLYQFSVREVCTDIYSTSDFSKWSSTAKTLASHSLPPSNLYVEADTLTQNSQVIHWTADDSSCITAGNAFKTWVVEIQETEQLRGDYMEPHYMVPWRVAEGTCASGSATDYLASDFSISSCTATGLLFSTKYSYRVREICISDYFSSEFSETNEIALATHASCSPGLYTNPNIKDTCNKCPVGKYNTEFGKESCKNCVIGRYAASEGMTVCDLCLPGTEGRPGAAVGSSPTCIECPVAKYNDEYGSSAGGCKGCPVGKVTDEIEEQCVQHVQWGTTRTWQSNQHAKYVQSANLQM